MPTQFQDYYATLGVPKTATQKEVRSAFRRLARTYHPDVNKDPAAVQKFKDINEAHEVLSDPEKRRKYDELGPQWEQYEQWEKAGRPGGNPFGTGGGAGHGQMEYQTVNQEELEQLFGRGDSPFSDFFYTMFGQSGPRQHRRTHAPSRRGSNVEGEVSITLEEAYAGVKRTVELSDGGRTRRVEVSIPAGITDGARIRAAGQGAQGLGSGAAGDLYMKVHVIPHPLFAREGDDLSATVPVPLDTALLGGTVRVPSIRGGNVDLNIPSETQNGSRLRLRGLGMPHLRGSGHGDLYATVNVRLPIPLTPEQRSAAHEFREKDQPST